MLFTMVKPCQSQVSLAQAGSLFWTTPEAGIVQFRACYCKISYLSWVNICFWLSGKLNTECSERHTLNSMIVCIKGIALATKQAPTGPKNTLCYSRHDVLLSGKEAFYWFETRLSDIQCSTAHTRQRRLSKTACFLQKQGKWFRRKIAQFQIEILLCVLLSSPPNEAGNLYRNIVHTDRGSRIVLQPLGWC